MADEVFSQLIPTEIDENLMLWWRRDFAVHWRVRIEIFYKNSKELNKRIRVYCGDAKLLNLKMNTRSRQI